MIFENEQVAGKQQTLRTKEKAKADLFSGYLYILKTFYSQFPVNFELNLK